MRDCFDTKNQKPTCSCLVCLPFCSRRLTPTGSLAVVLVFREDEVGNRALSGGSMFYTELHGEEGALCSKS